MDHEDEVYAHTAPQVRRQNPPPRFASQAKLSQADLSNEDEGSDAASSEHEDMPQQVRHI